MSGEFDTSDSKTSITEQAVRMIPLLIGGLLAIFGAVIGAAIYIHPSINSVFAGEQAATIIPVLTATFTAIVAFFIGRRSGQSEARKA